MFRYNVKIIRKYFTKTETVQLLTSNFYSKLYFGSEIWHIPSLNHVCKKMLLSASANALKLCNKYHDPSISYVDLHSIHRRALPNNFCLYRHSLLLYRLFNSAIPKNDWIDLNFQTISTSRQMFFEARNNSFYKVGNNLLVNRFSCINKKITLSMLNLSIETYKVKCKALFLMWNFNDFVVSAFVFVFACVLLLFETNCDDRMFLLKWCN